VAGNHFDVDEPRDRPSDRHRYRCAGADVIDERLRDLGLPTNQLRTGHDEIHRDASVERNLLSDQRRQLQRLCLRHERDRRRLGHGGGYLCLHGCHHDDGGGGRCEAR
jgi:hypothetical protein